MCIVAAIVGPNPLGITCEQNKPHILKSTIENFEASSSVGDYHGNFNTMLYEKWFNEKLIPALKQLGGVFSIILDNAKYHCSLGTDLPKLSYDKNKYYDKMMNAGISCDPNETKIAMIARFNEWKEKSASTIDRSAGDHGYLIWRTPEYESELQPIEYLWAYVKGETAKEYKVVPTLSDVRINLLKSFDNASQKEGLIEGIIRHTKEKSESLYQYYNENIAIPGISYNSINDETDIAIDYFFKEIFDGEEE